MNDLTCKLTSPELRQRKTTVVASLKNQVIQKEDLDNGYRYQFAASDRLTDELISFIKTEKQCCSFFEFSITFQEHDTWLTISGPAGAKNFIDEELEL